MTDYEKQITSLLRHRADFTALRKDNKRFILCFHTYRNASDEVIGYVYLWQDTYTLDGEFLEHKTYNED